MENLLIHSPIIEKAVLGCFLVNEKSFLRYGQSVLPDYFWNSRFKKIFECLVSGVRSPRLIVEKYPDFQKDVTSIVDGYSSGVDVEAEVYVLADRYHRRRLVMAAEHIRKTVKDTDIPVDQITEEAVSKISNEYFDYGRPSHIKDVIPDVLVSLEKRIIGEREDDINTGIPDVDAVLGCFERKEVTIIAARPSMGKTSFVLHIIRHNAIVKKIPVLFFSLEMGKEQIVGRIIFSHARASYGSALLGSKRELLKVSAEIGLVAESNIFIDDHAGQTVHVMSNKAEYYVKNCGVKALFVDHIGFIKNHRSGRSRHEEISEISKGFVHLSKKLDVPVVVVSQLSREVERRKPPVPMLSDLRESGSLEEDARKVILLYREDYYKRDTEKKGQVDIIVAKNHNGKTGPVTVHGEKDTMTFNPIRSDDWGDSSQYDR